MRIRHIAAFTIAALVACVVTFQAFNADPPEPYVEIIHGGPVGSHTYEECRGGLVYGIYVTNDGREMTPVTDGQPCLDGRPPSSVRYPRD